MIILIAFLALWAVDSGQNDVAMVLIVALALK